MHIVQLFWIACQARRLVPDLSALQRMAWYVERLPVHEPSPLLPPATLGSSAARRAQIAKYSVMTARQKGQLPPAATMLSQHCTHSLAWPHGMITVPSGRSMHTTHSSSSSRSPSSCTGTNQEQSAHGEVTKPCLSRVLEGCRHCNYWICKHC